MDDVMAEGEAAENPCRARFLVLVSHYVSDLSGDLGMLHVDLAINEQRPVQIASVGPLAARERSEHDERCVGWDQSSCRQLRGEFGALRGAQSRPPSPWSPGTTTAGGEFDDVDGCPDWLMCSPDRV